MGNHEHQAKTRTERLIEALEANTRALRKSTCQMATLEEEISHLQEQLENERDPVEKL